MFLDVIRRRNPTLDRTSDRAASGGQDARQRLCDRSRRGRAQCARDRGRGGQDMDLTDAGDDQADGPQCAPSVARSCAAASRRRSPSTWNARAPSHRAGMEDRAYRPSRRRSRGTRPTRRRQWRRTIGPSSTSRRRRKPAPRPQSAGAISRSLRGSGAEGDTFYRGHEGGFPGVRHRGCRRRDRPHARRPLRRRHDLSRACCSIRRRRKVKPTPKSGNACAGPLRPSRTPGGGDIEINAPGTTSTEITARGAGGGRARRRSSRATD